MGLVRVKLVAGHPTGMMLARLADDSVVEVRADGVVVAEDQVTEGMRHAWFEIVPWAESVAGPIAEAAVRLVEVLTPKQSKSGNANSPRRTKGQSAAADKKSAKGRK